jgi:hypothetical protein
MPAPIVRRPLIVRARSSIASKLRRRRSPAPSSTISVEISPSTSETLIAIRVGGPRRIACVTASRMIWYSATCARSARLELELNLVRQAGLVGERPDGRREPLVPQDDRLDVEREVAQRADRLAVPLERRGEHALRVVEPVRLDRADRGVEHQADPGHVLNGAVVEEERQPTALVLLCGDELVGQS